MLKNSLWAKFTAEKKTAVVCENTNSILALVSLLLCKHFEVVDVVPRISKLLVANTIRT